MFKRALLCAAVLLLCAANVFADYAVEVELENTLGEKKTDWPVVLRVCHVLGRDMPAGSLNPKGYRVTDEKGNELVCGIEEIPPYDQQGNNELVFIIPSMEAGAKMTVTVSNTGKASAKLGKIDLVGNANNLLKNSGFEKGAEKAVDEWTGGLFRDTEVKHSGDASLRLRGTNKVSVKYKDAIPLHKGSSYYFGGWGKTDNVSRHALYNSKGAYFGMAGFNNRSNAVEKDPKQTAARRTAGIEPMCATRDWYKMRFQVAGHDEWGVKEASALAEADTTALELVLDQRKQFLMKDKFEGTWWVDDVTLFEQPKVTVRFDKLLAPSIKDGVFLFTCPTSTQFGELRERYGAYAAWPMPWEELKAFDRYGVKGQRVPFLLGMVHKKPLKQVQVRLKGGELAGPGGAKLALAEVEYTPGWIAKPPAHLLGPHTDPIDLADEQGMPYFVVSFVVPRDATAGKYTGTVEVAAEGKVLKEIPLVLRVQDLEMPILRDLYIGMIFQGDVVPFNDEGLRQYSKSGWSSVTRFGGFFKYTKNPDGSRMVDLDDLDKKMKWLVSYGITGGVAPHSEFDMGPQWNGGTIFRNSGGKPNDPGTKVKYQAEVKRIEEAQKAHPDWPRMIYMTWDEPSTNPTWTPGTQSKCHGGPCEMMGWINEVAPDAPTTLDAHFFVFDRILKYYTMPSFDDPSNFCGPELYAYMKSLGKNYGFAGAAGGGEIARYQPGMMIIASGAKYMHAWHLGGSGQLMGVVDKKVLRAIGMVAAGEGMDDLKIHRLLTDLIAAAKKGGDPAKLKIATEAEAYLAKTHTVWNADHAYAASWPYLGYAADWGYERFYQDWQEQMARYAAALAGVKWVE